jgi:hypothetical protein
MRSSFTEIDVLVGEVMINSLKVRQVNIIKEMRWNID